MSGALRLGVLILFLAGASCTTRNSSLVDTMATGPGGSAPTGAGGALGSIDGGLGGVSGGAGFPPGAGGGTVRPSAGCGAGLQPGAPWPMRGRCVDNGGASPHVGAQTAQESWSIVINPSGTSPSAGAVIAADGTVYMGSVQGLHAVTPDGAEKWLFPTGVLSSPALGIDGVVYAFSVDGRLYALDPDGSMRWSFAAATGPSAFDNSPAIGADGTVYFGSAEGRVFAVSPDGVERWHLDVPVRGSPAIGPDGTLYFGADGTLTAIDPAGTKKWSLSSQQSEILSSWFAVDQGGSILVATSSGVRAIGSDGIERWFFDSGPTESPPAIGADGVIYVCSHRGVFSLRPDGQPIWSTLGIGACFGSALALGADGTLYATVQQEALIAIDANGAKKWSFPGSYGSAPAIAADGTIVVAMGDGQLHAIGP